MTYLYKIYSESKPTNTNRNNKLNLVAYTTKKSLAEIIVKTLNKNYRNTSDLYTKLTKTFNKNNSKYFYKKFPLITSSKDMNKFLSKQK